MLDGLYINLKKQLWESDWLGTNLVEPSKAHTSTLDPAAQLWDDKEVGKAAGLHLKVQV